MGISYKNSSGYPDPTAFLAVQNMELEERILHIKYPTGGMDIRMDAFFPCSVDRAKKIFRLVCQYCPQEEKEKLLRFLQEKERCYLAQVESFQSQAKRSSDPADRDKLVRRRRESEKLRQRTHRNIEIFRAKEEKG